MEYINYNKEELLNFNKCVEKQYIQSYNSCPWIQLMTENSQINKIQQYGNYKPQPYVTNLHLKVKLPQSYVTNFMCKKWINKLVTQKYINVIENTILILTIKYSL